MFGKTICFSEFRVTGSRCENQILLQFYLQMLNEKYNMFKIQTDNHYLRKTVATNKNYILRKMGFKFENPNCNVLC